MNWKRADQEDLEKIADKNVIIIISDGKMKISDLPDYGEIEITCHERKVKNIKEIRTTKF